MQETRRPENKRVMQLNVSYQEAYRLISESFLQNCNLIKKSVQPIIYVDSGYATITNELEGIVYWSLDLKQQTDSSSVMEFYSASDRYGKDGDRIARHVNNREKKCYFND